MSAGLSSYWALDPDVDFLNHGSFGACPRAVLAAQSALRERMEREPVRFFVRELPELLDAARGALERFVGAAPNTLSFAPNATTAVDWVLRSLSLSPGDEILLTDHGYGACRSAAARVAEASGARVAVARLPFPGATPEQALGAILAAVTPRTRIALVDHVTSPTGLVLPAGPIVDALSARDVDVLVDGAHAPGMLDLDLAALGAAYYAGNCHKWLCAPKGAGFLVVRPDRQDGLRPSVTSHGATEPLRGRPRFRIEAEWTGTDDPTAWLAVPAAIEHMAGLLPGGWPAVRAHNRALALAARDLLCEALGVAAPCPDAMIGSLAAVPIAGGAGPEEPSAWTTDPLQDALLLQDRIEVPVIHWPSAGQRLVRVSAQLYNEPAQYERLADALSARGAGIARPAREW